MYQDQSTEKVYCQWKMVDIIKVILPTEKSQEKVNDPGQVVVFM